MANVKFIAVSRGLRGIVDYVTNREKTVEQLISGVNCVARTAVPEFEAVKKQFRKTEGRGYYHIVQAFAPDDPLDFATAHELGVKLAEHFKGYQCIVVTHMNTAHIHNHIIMNSASFETGMKFHQSAREMQQKYTTPENIRCRDSKLFDQTLTRENMELYFQLGGADYLQACREVAYDHREPTPTLEDTVCGMAGTVAAICALCEDENTTIPRRSPASAAAAICALCEDENSEVSDLARELYYSSLLLQELVEWYQSRRQERENYEEEYEQYHGFDMTIM